MKLINKNVKIGHVHLKVSNIDRSLDFYCGVLGFTIWYAKKGVGNIQTLPAFDDRTIRKIIKKRWINIHKKHNIWSKPFRPWSFPSIREMYVLSTTNKWLRVPWIEEKNAFLSFLYSVSFNSLQEEKIFVFAHVLKFASNWKFAMVVI